MKISKNTTSIQATTKSGLNSKYTESTDYIRSAIYALAPVAKDDVLAQEAIANLSVVLFELQE